MIFSLGKGKNRGKFIVGLASKKHKTWNAERKAFGVPRTAFEERENAAFSIILHAALFWFAAST